MCIANCNYLIYMKYLFNEFIFQIMMAERFYEGQINCLEQLQSRKQYSFKVLPHSLKSYTNTVPPSGGLTEWMRGIDHLNQHHLHSP